MLMHSCPCLLLPHFHPNLWLSLGDHAWLCRTACQSVLPLVRRCLQATCRWRSSCTSRRSGAAARCPGEGSWGRSAVGGQASMVPAMPPGNCWVACFLCSCRISTFPPLCFPPHQARPRLRAGAARPQAPALGAGGQGAWQRVILTRRVPRGVPALQRQPRRRPAATHRLHGAGVMLLRACATSRSWAGWLRRQWPSVMCTYSITHL